MSINSVLNNSLISSFRGARREKPEACWRKAPTNTLAALLARSRRALARVRDDATAINRGLLKAVLIPLLAAVCLACPLAALAAHSQPLTVDADRSLTTLERKADTSQTTYTGHVVIRRGTTVIHGAKAVVHTRDQRLEKAVVSGKPANFSVHQAGRQRPVQGRAQRITYQVAANTLVLEGDAHLHREGQKFSAARVQYNLGTRAIQAHGKQGERVHVVIPPAQSSASPSHPHS
jgi:lipopolysaccharide export system protein LptA